MSARAPAGGRSAPALRPGAWVRMEGAPEVEALYRERRRALASRLPAGLPEPPDEALRHPSFASWLSAAESIPPAEAEARERHRGLGGGLWAASALLRGRDVEADGRIDADGHLHLSPLGRWLEFGPRLADAPVRLLVRRGRLEVELPGGALAGVPARLLLEGEGGAAEGCAVRAAPRLSEGVEVSVCDPLILWPIRVHGVATPDAAETREFRRVLAGAYASLRGLDPGLERELSSCVRVVVPLLNPKKLGSVSSTYAELPGAVCLSHSEDLLLQQETLIHEYCHSKLNLLTQADPLLRPGQGNAVFYSPWRDDPRPLRGIFLGAHAFLQVAALYVRALKAGGLEGEARRGAQLSAARRALQSAEALRVVAARGLFTPFGRKVASAMRAEASRLERAVRAFPPELLREAEDRVRAHREERALGESGFHRMESAAQE